MMLDLTYSIFVEEFPGSFETGITLIEENLEEEILIDLFDTAQEKQDYSIYFLIIFIMQKRGIDFDKNQLLPLYLLILFLYILHMFSVLTS